MSCLIEINNVTVSYRENVALKDVTLTIKQNSFVSIIGPNGAGKTTLLTVINGLGNILKGSVHVFGLPLNLRNINHIRREVGYVPQNLNIDPRFPITVHDVIRMGKYGKIGCLRYPKKKDEDIVRQIIELVEIKDLIKRPIGHLSGGEQQKVAIARALVQEPKIMLFDEPTSNLDPRAQREILYLIEKIYKTSHLTMVFVSHILKHIPPSCTEAVLMKKGRIIRQCPIKDALQESLLTDLYECPIKITHK